MSDAIDATGQAIAACADTITKLRAALVALETLAFAGSDLSAIDAAEVKARALDAMRAVELREEHEERERADHAERRASRVEYTAYLARHIEIQVEQRDALRAILAEVTRRP